MAEQYGTTPAKLLADDLGDWSFNVSCYQLDMTQRQRDREEQQRKHAHGRGPRSEHPPDWPE